MDKSKVVQLAKKYFIEKDIEDLEIFEAVIEEICAFSGAYAKELASEQKPVAHRHLHEDGLEYYDDDFCDTCEPLYTIPPDHPAEIVKIFVQKLKNKKLLDNQLNIKELKLSALDRAIDLLGVHGEGLDDYKLHTYLREMREEYIND